MLRGKLKFILFAILLVILGFLLSGVFAANNIVLNSGDAANLGAGAQRVDPCDNDVNISAITYNDGEKVYLQGFQYDNADKPACVGYDFETRFVSSAGDPVNLFATSSLTAEQNLIRVFAPTSTATWQLGLGAQPSVEVTVTQLSASSFKVIFTNPIALASDMGRIVMAELTHLPIGTFTSSYTQVGTVTGNWYNSCFTNNGSVFYGLDIDAGLFKSSALPTYPASTSGAQISAVTSSNIPLNSSIAYRGLGCSTDGKYLIVAGDKNQLSYSSDYGITWESKTATSYMPSGSGVNLAAAISDDGKVVAAINNGYINIWVNGNFWTSKSSVANAYQNITGANGVAMSSNGNTVWAAGGSGSYGLYRYDNVLSYSSSGDKVLKSPQYTSFTNSADAFGGYIRSVACSADGKTVAIASWNNSTVYVSRDSFATYYQPSNLATTNQGVAIKPLSISMTKDGKGIAVAFGDTSTQTKGTTQTSSDYGRNMVSTAFTDSFEQTISMAPLGTRIVTGGASLGGTKTKLILMSSD